VRRESGLDRAPGCGGPPPAAAKGKTWWAGGTERCSCYQNRPLHPTPYGVMRPGSWIFRAGSASFNDPRRGASRRSRLANCACRP